MSTGEETVPGIPLSERERRIWAEIEWAEQDPELRTRYAGQWVALAGHTVVAHGPDRAEVLSAASGATRLPVEDLAVWFLADALADYPPDADGP
jgi:hypothetical protein